VKKKIKNILESIRARLLNISKAENIDFDSLLLRYMQERFLYRLSISEYKNNFVLKGGLLLLSLDIPETRLTIDIDFLATRIKNKPDIIAAAFNEVSKIDVNDGVRFDGDSIRHEYIQEDADYVGLRFKMMAHLAQAKKRVQIDIGFGDIITPTPSSTTIDMPTILHDESPRLKAYSIESVISEKLEAMVKHSVFNSRIKDFYDVYIISKNRSIQGETLSKAIINTFKSRKAEIPEEVVAFTPQFYRDSDKNKQWTIFLSKAHVGDINVAFPEVIEHLKLFLNPVIHGIINKDKTKLTWDNKKAVWAK
jgi:predicted nucleotidyltransferase component of viral defense system